MSRRLPAFRAAAGLTGLAVLSLSACSTSTATTAATSAATVAAAADSTTGAAASSSAGTGAASTAGTPASSAADWTLSLPSSINGDARLADPTSSTDQELQQGMEQAEQIAGISNGTKVEGVYDDSADGAWLVVLGLNGSGYTGTRLVHDVDSDQPGVSGAGVGDEVSTAEPATVGPHGGTAICQQTTASIETVEGSQSAEVSTCYWVTPSTFGVVTLITKVGSPVPDWFIPADKVNSVMQYVRPAVEHQG